MTNKQISDREQIAQVAHDTRVNERIACFFEQISHSLFCSQKISDSPNFLKIKSYLYVHFLKFFFIERLIPSFLVSNVSELLR